MLLSLDQALKTSGYSVFQDKDHCLECSSFTVPPKQNALPERLDRILLEIENICKKYPINRVAFENTQQQYNVETFKKLNYLEAILEYWCSFSELEYVIISPSHWRKIISDNYGIKFGRKRAEQKQAAQDFAARQLQKEVDSDAADSYCIGLAALVNYEFEDKYKKSAF